MQTLREKLFQSADFLIGTELVSVRGSMSERNAVKTRTFANELVECPAIDWISITDNAGGNPQLPPTALGKPILYAGKEVVIHLTCKDLNRNGLESEAWLLNSEGFHNILAMTGDYPIAGNEGLAKPVFDIDSVGLISMLDQMNRGFDPRDSGTGISPVTRRTGGTRVPLPHDKTQFCIGAVTTNYKLREGEVMPQYFKLQKKVECGAQFIINQIGFDARKTSELRAYMDAHGMAHTPLIGNVYLLNARVAEIFAEGKIPGVVLPPLLLEICRRHAQSPDGGKSFFQEFAAKQMAIYRGLGYRGAYLGGVHNFPAIEKIFEIEKSFAPDDWKQFAREINFSRPGEFFFYAQNPTTGLADSSTRNSTPAKKSKRVGPGYCFSKAVHNLMFTPGSAIAKLGAKLCRNAKDPMQGLKPMRALEHVSKAVLYSCKDCGDCSLPEIAFLCPESQCAKNQRNGPCGGTREGRCEVDGYGDCIWLRAYERLKHDGNAEQLVEHAPVVQNQGLRGTSAWANFWLRRDHTAKGEINAQTTEIISPETIAGNNSPSPQERAGVRASVKPKTIRILSVNQIKRPKFFMTKNPKIPANYQTIMPYLILRNATGFISFTEKVFDATQTHKTMRDEHTIMHAEIMIGECTIMFADATSQFPERPAGLFIYVRNADETYAKAIAEGATSLTSLADQPYGRSGGVKDPFGNSWWITSIKS